MPYLSGFDRNQSVFFSLNDFVDPASPIRLIDAFVQALNLDELEFKTYSPSARGQQPYDRADLLKLHIYGYINGIRSSRKLALEATRNVELMWLINNATPAKSCISDFVKNNKRPIKNTFKKFVDFLKFAGFIDAKKVVIDGTKIRAQNSRNKYYSIKKIDATISFFNSQMDKYLHALKSAESSTDIDESAILPIKQKIDHYKDKLDEFTSLKKKMTEDNLSQVTLTDPDSRMMFSHGNSDISYNLQTSVDSKNSLIIASDVVNDINDTNQLENMVINSKDNLEQLPEASIADMGYFNSEQIANCENLGTQVFVKRPKTKNATDNSDFSIDKFTFIPEKNIYICPTGQELSFTRYLQKRKSKSDKDTSIIGSEYTCSSCFNCPNFGKCTRSLAGRKITRNFYQNTLDTVQKRFEENPDIYTLRKCVVEHPFGTIKRSLGYTYFLRKGLESVKVEATLISLAYDFKRLASISKVADILKKIEDFCSSFCHFYLAFLCFLFQNKKLINFS